MQVNDRIAVLVDLGKQLNQFSDKLQAVIQHTYIRNGWFTVENTTKALHSIRDTFLQEEVLVKMAIHYALGAPVEPKTVALVLAGNIPMVGFHDVLCVFLSGHRSLVKLSEKDKFLLPFLVQMMSEKYPSIINYFEFTDRLGEYDAVIATGSNNSARYFESYFGKYPHIIRRNRNAVAVLSGKESPEDLAGIGEDIFTYFGLGCRNVSKLYIPKDYDFDPLLTALHEHRQLVLHNKYKNNFDYNYTLLILNKVSYKANGCILLTEEESLTSRIASLHYSYYETQEDLLEKLEGKRDEIQCVVSSQALPQWETIKPGKAQQPGLMDYADGVDTMQFLLGL